MFGVATDRSDDSWDGDGSRWMGLGTHRTCRLMHSSPPELPMLVTWTSPHSESQHSEDIAGRLVTGAETELQRLGPWFFAHFLRSSPSLDGQFITAPCRRSPCPNTLGNACTQHAIQCPSHPCSFQTPGLPSTPAISRSNKNSGHASPHSIIGRGYL